MTMETVGAAAAFAAGFPVVECQRLKQREGWACDIWVIASCPFCGQRHTHGAGDGFRLAHCVTILPKESYYLIESGSSR